MLRYVTFPAKLTPMTPPHDQERYFDRVILLLLLALFLLTSPLRLWWAAADALWYAPYLLWGVIIFFAYWLQRRIDRHDH